jgi:hypothetical protein
MEVGITEQARSTMLRAAVARVERDELKAALARSPQALSQAPRAVGNALNALRKHRDPSIVVDKPQYRAALPYLAAVIADGCLARAIEVLGEHSDDPSREQLLVALDQVGDSFSDVTIAVMLASVAAGDMPASDLCFDIAATDERFGLIDWAAFASGTGTPRPDPGERTPTTPEQREARRLKKQRDAEERRKKMEVVRRAGEQRRRAKKAERPNPDAGADGGPAKVDVKGRGVASRLTRRAALTPAQEEEFDRNDPWTAGVVFAWVPFDSVDPIEPDLDGKSRRCVVVAGSPAHLLVRPGYSEGGVKSRDWKSVPPGSTWSRCGSHGTAPARWAGCRRMTGTHSGRRLGAGPRSLLIGRRMSGYDGSGATRLTWTPPFPSARRSEGGG